ncbi:hypothetical protein [Actinopolyspora halophila]|uniref:hypothetical protein n=1 Tax=Actinopolyspora halophila TaxID=1850 RepID=UPI00035F6006|nr:hypothetical protein [Actinopolyspora halophila]
MSEPTAGTGSTRRRRSTRVSQQLARARQRNAEQLAEQRAREQRVETALRQFVEAGEAIATEQARCEDKVAVYQRKIDKLRADSEEKVVGEYTKQAQAALALHEGGGRTVEQVAELLELDSEKQARRLIASGREALSAGTDTDPPSDHDERERAEPRLETTADHEISANGAGERADPTEDAGQQHRAQADLVPAPTAHNEAQGE